VRAGAESSRTTASVGSLGEQTLFAQRSPYGHPKSEIRSQICFGRGDLSLWTGGTQGEARRLGETANGPDGCGSGDRDSGACAAAAGSLSSSPAHRAAAVGGVRVEIAGCQGAIADSATAGDRRRCQRERSQTVPRRPIADGASVNDRGPWHRGRSRTVPARTIVDRASAGGSVAPLAEMPMGSRCAMALESGLSTVRSSTRPLLARPRLS
jgi:hypothetical protein